MVKLTVEIINGNVSVQYDDGEAPVNILPPEAIPHRPAPAPKPAPAKTPENCGYCKKRGSPCVRHGGKPTAGNYKATEEKEDAFWCKQCRAYTTHSTEDHPAEPVNTNPPPPVEPEFMPGHEKDPAELESWRPKPKLPGDQSYGKATRTDRENNRVIPGSDL